MDCLSLLLLLLKNFTMDLTVAICCTSIKTTRMHQAAVYTFIFFPTSCIWFMITTVSILYRRTCSVLSASKNPIDKHPIALLHFGWTAIDVFLMVPLQTWQATNSVFFTGRWFKCVYATAYGTIGRKICSSCCYVKWRFLLLVFNVRNMRQADLNPALLSLVSIMRIITMSLSFASILLLGKATFLVAINAIWIAQWNRRSRIKRLWLGAHLEMFWRNKHFRGRL